MNYAPVAPGSDQIISSLTEPVKYKDLATESPRDAKWDDHKTNTQAFAMVLRCDGGETLEKQATRVDQCSDVLGFAWESDDETGECRLRLRKARFCRVRLCVICQWRRSMMWTARMYEALPTLMEQYPKSRFLMLTLTIKNVEIDSLRHSLNSMGKAWHKLIRRAEFKPILGWVRTVEITRGKDGSAHPHFHVLLMVSPSYFNGRNYITQQRWTELWQESGRLDYQPIVDIRKVKSKWPKTGDVEPVPGGVVEVLKYAVKPSDLAVEPDSEEGEWVRELARQIHHSRAIATGGVLKDFFKEPTSDEEMIHPDGEKQEEEDDGEEGPTVDFNYAGSVKRYRRRL